MERILCLLLTLALASSVGEAYNILITVPGISGSQNLVMYRLGQLLVDHGHKVTILTPTLIEAKGPKTNGVKFLKFPSEAPPEELEFLNSMAHSMNWEHSAPQPSKVLQIPRVFRAFKSYCSTTLNRKDIMDQLEADNFDVIIIHHFDVCGHGIAHLLGIESTIWMSTAFMLDYLQYFSGAPMPVSYVPSFVQAFSDHMTLPQRMKNMASFVGIIGAYKKLIVPSFTSLFREKYGPDFPDLIDVMKRTQLYFVYSDHLIDFPRPSSPNTVQIGGFVMEKAEPLDEKWSGIMSSDRATKHGVVIFSLGSIANCTTMPQRLRLSFLNAFKKLPQLVIWKWNGDFPEAKNVPNIMLSDWMPQKDLLVHKNMRLFITHGGYNSITEAAYSGVPLIVIPLFGDQFSNARRVERIHIGVALEKADISLETVSESLKTVLQDKSYLSSAKRLSRMLRAQPLSPKEQIVKWVEFLAEFKTLPLVMSAVHELNPIQYFMLDAIFILATGFFLSLTICFCLCRCCCRKICCRASQAKSKAE